MSHIITIALHHYLTAQFGSGGPVRRFFRLDGFDDETYQGVLDQVRAENNTLAGQPLWVRTTAAIFGYEEYALEAGRSATWYRNHVPSGYGLVLIFNRRTSDAQSLKDIYPVTENLLATDGLSHLIAAAFADYQPSSKQITVLKQFLAHLRQDLFQPQLRDLVAFLSALNTHLHNNPGTSIEAAIAESLPFLGLFRCRELALILNTQKGNRQLRDVFRAARLGTELLDEAQLSAYLDRLDKAEFDDDSLYGGLSPQEKRNLLRRFLTDVLTNRNELLQVLQLDWREIAPILYQKARRTKTEQLQELAVALQAALEAQQLPREMLPEAVQDTLQNLTDGRGPEEESLDYLLIEYGDSLAKPLKNKLRRLRGVKAHSNTDFIAGVAHLSVEILTLLGEELSEGTTLQVRFDEGQLKKVDAREAEALLAFRTLYGGIESMMPTIQWNLQVLWDLASSHASKVGEEEEEDEEREKIVKVNLIFHVAVVNRKGRNLYSAELTWHYRSDGPAAVTLAHVRAEAEKLSALATGEVLTQGVTRRLPIPIYNTCPDAHDVGDLDLSRPLSSLGAWYSEATNLGDVLRGELEHRAQPEDWNAVREAVARLEEAWARFVADVAESGVLAADINSLLAAYESLFHEAVVRLQRGQEAAHGFRVLTQAWIVGPRSFDEWAVVPFLHPLKLLWWRERAKRFDTFIHRLLNPTARDIIVDVRHLRQELSATYGSAGYPAVLALPGRDRRPDYFLPVHEEEGYELFCWIGQAGIAHGFDPDLVLEQESEQAAQLAARELSHVVQNYIETYPFVRDGLEVYLVQCRNGTLPGLLVEYLDRLARRQNWTLRLSVIVHSTDRGAPLYRRVTEWLKAHEEFTERPASSYFPPVTLKVLECSYDELFQQVDDTDIVILPDVLVEKGQSLEAESVDPETIPLTGYLPIYCAQQAPFERGEFTRDTLLTPLPQPALLQHFYNVLWAARERKPVPENKTIRFRLRVSLQDWEHELAELHRRFNWVTCYDTTVDRFLLEDTFPGTVQVIRYSLGLGVKRRHNLTVSSSYRAQDIVVRRLTVNLDRLLPGTPHGFRQQIAQRLVNEAKQVSGDIVLRAAGPGAYLNELIGLVLAKHLTEQRYRDQHPDVLMAWIYLDDFAHWFDKKFPDLLFVALVPESTNRLLIHAEVLETKCIGETNFVVESADAQRQVAQGVNRLAQAWMAGNQHLDAPYWYDQLYRAVVGNLAVHRDQMHGWQTFRRCLPEGDFMLDLSGHAWVFCYEGAAGVVGVSDEGSAAVVAPDVQGIPHRYHHFGRAGLRKALRDLVEDVWQLHAPPETWSPTHDESLPPVTEPASALASPPVAEPTLTVEPRSEPAGVVPSETSINLDLTWLQNKARDLEHALRQYNIQIYPVDLTLADVGPSIIRFKLRLRPGEQLSRLQRTANDLARELALTSAPLIDNVLGTNYVSVDLPRLEPETVHLLPLLTTLPCPSPSELPIIIGQTPDGRTIIEDMSEFPHLLVAGATNSGKSVFLRSLVLCLLTQHQPASLRLLIVDPKRTDFTFFEGLPYLLGDKVITDKEEARDMLLDLVHSEMPRRQQIIAGRSLRVKEFNRRYPSEALPSIVVIIDEYAQLISIMTKRERESFERDLMSLAAVARATGIYLILATQRPSVDIVTGTLKANLDARIAFRVASAINSRIVIDQGGAENLLGRGDMLFRRPSGEIIRLQAPFVDEVTLQEYLGNFRDEN